MRIIINEDSSQLIVSATNPTPRASLALKRRDTPDLDFIYVRPFGVPLNVDAGAVSREFRFGAKSSGDFPGDYVVSNYDSGSGTFPHTKITSGSDVVYRVTPSLNTLALDALFLVHPLTQTVASQSARYALTGLAVPAVVRQSDTGAYWQVINATQLANAAGWKLADEKASVSLVAELQRTVDGEITSTATFPLTLENDINRGNEGVPVNATPAYPSPGNLQLRDVAGRYILASFAEDGVGQIEKLFISVSSDGISWLPLNNAQPVYERSDSGYETGGFRDPSIIRLGEWYYICYTTQLADSFGLIKSQDLINWVNVGDVSVAGIAGTQTLTWCPEFFVEPGGDSYEDVRIFVSVRTSPSTAFSLYRLTPTNASLSAWTTPTLVTFGASGDFIDPTIIKNGSQYQMFIYDQPGNYKLATATSIDGTWSAPAAVGSPSLPPEGASAILLPDGRIRLYADRGPGLGFNESYTSAPTGKWTYGPSPFFTYPCFFELGFVPKHGTVLFDELAKGLPSVASRSTAFFSDNELDELRKEFWRRDNADAFPEFTVNWSSRGSDQSVSASTRTVLDWSEINSQTPPTTSVSLANNTFTTDKSGTLLLSYAMTVTATVAGVLQVELQIDDALIVFNNHAFINGTTYVSGVIQRRVAADDVIKVSLFSSQAITISRAFESNRVAGVVTP